MLSGEDKRKNVKMINNNNQKIDRIFDVVKKEIPGCHVIDMTKHCRVREMLGKNVAPFDFDEKFYDILKNKINAILV